MVGCVLSQLKPSELYFLSCGKGLGLRPRPFPQLRMWSSSGCILYIILIGLDLDRPHKSQRFRDSSLTSDNPSISSFTTYIKP